MQERLDLSAKRLVDVLAAGRLQKVVFAESCTCGLVSAALGGVAGVSEFHCGSIVTYRESAKMAFLGVDADVLEKHTDVSQPVTEQMAVKVLERLPEATWSAAVTGHLGPNAPTTVDGTVFVAIAHKNVEIKLVSCQKFVLVGSSERVSRQVEAASLVLESLHQAISSI